MTKKILLTGLQSTGDLHIGNYFGALKPFIDDYLNYQSYLMVVDYHALTSVRNPNELRENTKNVVRDYLAAGLDPSQCVLFRQSDVPAHTELAWILNCMIPVPYLMLAHSYKDKVAKGLEANAGLFTYPMLMAADILLYDTDIVPVGEDQRQHVEYAREAAKKFNASYGEVFKSPEERINKEVAIVPGTDGAKMSKSYKNTIPLFASRDEIAKAVMSIVTDSGSDRPEHVYAIHKLFRTDEDLESLYDQHKGKYKALKDALVEDIDSYFAPMREKRESISDEEVARVLKEGGEKANAAAEAKMETVRKAVGVR